MAKKSTKKIVKRHRLEDPVHNLVGYGILFVLAFVVLAVVYSLQWYIIP